MLTRQVHYGPKADILSAYNGVDRRAETENGTIRIGIGRWRQRARYSNDRRRA